VAVFTRFGLVAGPEEAYRRESTPPQSNYLPPIKQLYNPLKQLYTPIKRLYLPQSTGIDLLYMNLAEIMI